MTELTQCVFLFLNQKDKHNLIIPFVVTILDKSHTSESQRRWILDEHDSMLTEFTVYTPEFWQTHDKKSMVWKKCIYLLLIFKIFAIISIYVEFRGVKILFFFSPRRKPPGSVFSSGQYRAWLRQQGHLATCRSGVQLRVSGNPFITGRYGHISLVSSFFECFFRC